MSYRAALLDALAVIAAYGLALLVRIGGRFERAEPELAAVFVVVLALIQVGLAAPLGAYRPGWSLSRPRDLVVLAVPAMLTGLLVAAFNLVSPLHPIPSGSIPTGVVFAVAAVAAARLRSRVPALVRAAFPRELPPPVVRPVTGQPDLEATLVRPGAPVRDAIAAIDRDVSRIALVVDEQRVLLGTITDGDVRRALLAGKDIAVPCGDIMRPHPVVASTGTSDVDLIDLMGRHVIRQVPLVDGDGRVAGIRVLDAPREDGGERTPVLIMAGGRGARLGDIARTVPKPLVRVAGRPILETLVRDLAAQGFTRIVLAVAHRAEQIEHHFGDGNTLGVDIDYVRESTPLGTAGAIRLVAPTFGGPLLVTNADVLTRLSFRDLLDFHRTQGHELTIGAITSTQQLRYGLLETEGTRVVALREKPALRHLVNAGIYVVEPSLASMIPPDTRFDMDALIAAALRAAFRVGCFPIHEYWTDVGVPADLERAAKEYPAELARSRH